MRHFFQCITVICSSPVLPYYGITNRLVCMSVPNHGGFALVGDADGRDVRGLRAGVGQRAARGGELGVPDFHRIVLDPAGVRIVLRELALVDAAHAARAIEDDGAGTGGALVQREEELPLNHGDRLLV